VAFSETFLRLYLSTRPRKQCYIHESLVYRYKEHIQARVKGKDDYKY
jgi:hypothetical protein